MRKLLLSVLVAGLLAPATAPAFAATKRVRVGDNYFVSDGGVPTVTVARNTRVKWVWKGRSPHNVKVISGPARFGSSSMTSGTYVKKVKKAGTYTLYCSIHGAEDQSMKLVVE